MKRQNLLTAITVSLFSVAVIRQFVQSQRAGHASWGMTEWLINYAGGFVRRGLPGEVIYRLAGATGIAANHIVVVISFASFFGLLAFFLLRTTIRLPAYLVLSPVLMGLPAYQSFIVRKDAFCILLLIACIAIGRAGLPALVRLLWVNVVGIFGVLSHEEFFFLGFPVLVLLAAYPASDISDELQSLAMAALKMSPVVAAFVSTIAFRGNADIALAINASWADLWRRIQPEQCCMEAPAAAINALQWAPERFLALTVDVIRQFSFGIYVPLAWLLTAFLCFWFLCHFRRQEGEDGRATLADQHRLASILVLQLLMISPLFVLGRDFGRWMFLWTASSSAIHALNVDLSFKCLKWAENAAAFLLRSAPLRWPPSPWYLVLFGVPGCCWSGYAFVASTPLWYSLGAIGRLLYR